MDEPSNPAGPDRFSLSLRAVALVALAAAVVVTALMFRAHAGDAASGPLDNDDLARLRAAITEAPGAEALAAATGALRSADLDLRRRHARYKAFMKRGSYLLLAFVAVTVLGFKWARSRDAAPPRPPDAPVEPDAATVQRRAARARGAVGLAGIVFVAGLVGWLAAAPAVPPLERVPSAAGAGAGDPGRPPAEPLRIADQWPALRGPTHNAVAPAGDYPEAWGGPASLNVLWRAGVPLAGLSSPVVWGDRVCVTGASADSQQVFCFDAATGDLLWSRGVGKRSPRARGVEVFDDACYAACTPAIDGRRVYVVYASGDVAAFDLDGEPAWSIELGVEENTFGYASSPVVAGDLLIVQYDTGGLGELIALRAESGEEAWVSSRDVGGSWASPVLIDTAAGAQVVTISKGALIGHDQATGEVRWRVDGIVEDSDGAVAPTPAVFDGVVYAVNPGSNEVLAVRPGANEAEVLWRVEVEDDALATIPSPVSDGRRVYVPAAYGVIALDAATGQTRWYHESDDLSVGYPSPVLVGDRLYVPGGDGATLILEAGAGAAVLGRPRLDAALGAQPAFAHGRIFFRLGGELVAVGRTAGGDRP